MVQIDLIEVFKTGVFHNLKVGATKDWMKNNFPKPDYIVEENFWKYGNMDFFFDEDKLIEICFRSLEPLKGGKSFDINNWILSESKDLSLEFIISKLLSEKLDFSVLNTKVQEVLQVSIGLPKSSIYLIFQEDDPDDEEVSISHASKPIEGDRKEFKLVGFSILENLVAFHKLLQTKNGLQHRL
ncbi:MAG: hypothetical protein WAT91_06225 [Saprospiraceae bacterium]